MRIAIIGAGHWHVPMYLEHLAELRQVEVVAVSDPEPWAIDRARQYFPSARSYSDYRELLDNEELDLAMAHAPHNEMTDLARALIDAGVPFHMEKPMGLDADALAEVAEAAEKKSLFVSVPLVTRLFGVASHLLAMAENGELGVPVYYYFRLFAGSPNRYRQMGVDWMLDPARAGDGPLFNFGPHAIDLFIALAGLPSHVYCAATHALHHLPIPDVVSVTLRTSRGAYGVCEVSYSAPEGYDRWLAFRSDKVSYSGAPDVGQIWRAEGGPLAVDRTTSDEAYRIYTRDLVARVSQGRPPLVGIRQMVDILRVLNAAQRSLRSGQAERLDGGRS
ncbi:MAG: Gfo/Idh/MocA family oxidoreductase [Armatimonadetes bacterium]|nr:Gfo/Idh/MocA family oxidoreductase [Armatimonadota bacterium]